MEIANGKNMRLGIFDIEAYRALFDIGILNPDTGEWIEFEISRYKNDLYKFIKYYTENNKYDYWVSFNGIKYDHPVLEYICTKGDEWVDLSGHQISNKIQEFSSKLIDDMKYNIQPTFRESSFHVNPIDVFTINHFDNEAKRCSLKWCQFMMNMDVEETPIDFMQEELTEEEIKSIKHYRTNDVISTLGLLYVTLGQPDKVMELNGGHPVDELIDYKDNNKIQLRFDIEAETGLKCLNWSDVKIGEEKNKKDYMQALNIKDSKLLQPHKVKHPYGQRFKNFFPKTMSFQSEKLKTFFEILGEHWVLAEKQEFPIQIGDTIYTVAKGGLHSTEKHRCIITMQGWTLRDADVGAQYPNSIIKLGINPPHLKTLILDQFKDTVKLKDIYKQEGKIAKSHGDMVKVRVSKSREGLTKLQMNGGFYGKLGQPGSFLEYPEGVLRVCMGNQVEILMLIEALDLAGFKVVSGNTDGILTYYPTSREDEYMKICMEWEEKVGNVVLGKLEYAPFDGIWQDSVNSYIAKECDKIEEDGTITKGKIKRKGAFVTSYGMPGCEINKNKSKRIVALALGEYFINKKDPVEFIKSHKNIFDFCIGKKGWKDNSGLTDLWYEELLDETIVHKKIIRYYVSKSGCMIKKRGFNQKGVPVDSYCEAPKKDYFWMKEPLLKNFNSIKTVPVKEYDIDYDYYIIDTLERIDNIEKTKKAKSYAEKFKPQQQTILF